MLDPLDDLELPENLRKRIIVGEVVRELTRAQRRFGPFASPHEALAVVHEEYDELAKEVRDNKRLPDEYREKMRVEACQLAAMAMRLMHDCTHANDQHGGWRR